VDLAIMYHYVREPEEWKGSVPISPKAFEDHIELLGKTHEFIVPDDLTKSTVKPKCLLTFDDATRDQYEYAFDIMKRKGVPGYFTVMSGPLQSGEAPVFHLVHAALSLLSEKALWEELRPQLSDDKLAGLQKANETYSYEQSQMRRYIKYALNFLMDAAESKRVLEKLVFAHYGSKQKFIDEMYITVEQFEQMKKAGMALGVHCANHTPFTGDGQAYYENEIAPCAEFIRERLQLHPVWYTPPFGGGEKKLQLMDSLEGILRANGFKGAFTTNKGMINDVHSFWLNRIDCNEIKAGIAV